MLCFASTLQLFFFEYQSNPATFSIRLRICFLFFFSCFAFKTENYTYKHVFFFKFSAQSWSLSVTRWFVLRRNLNFRNYHEHESAHFFRTAMVQKNVMRKLIFHYRNSTCLRYLIADGWFGCSFNFFFSILSVQCRSSHRNCYARAGRVEVHDENKTTKVFRIQNDTIWDCSIAWIQFRNFFHRTNKTI